MELKKIICDICEKECMKGDGNSNFVGVIARLTPELEKKGYKFGYDFCKDCSEVVLSFLEEMKKDIKSKVVDK